MSNSPFIDMMIQTQWRWNGIVELMFLIGSDLLLKVISMKLDIFWAKCDVTAFIPSLCDLHCAAMRSAAANKPVQCWCIIQDKPKLLWKTFTWENVCQLTAQCTTVLLQANSGADTPFAMWKMCHEDSAPSFSHSCKFRWIIIKNARFLFHL